MADEVDRKPEGKVDPWMSVQAAADRLGVSRQTVYARAARGELKSKIVASRTIISRDDVEKAIADSDSEADKPAAAGGAR